MCQRRKPEFRFTPSFDCYSFESCFHDWRFFSLHRRPYPPFGWSSCFPRTIQLLLPASPCSRLSRPRSTIRQSDFRQAFGSSSLVQLVGPYKSSLSLTDLPCSHEILWLHASGTNPGSNSVHSPFRILSFCLPHSRDKVGYFNHDRFRGYLPVYCCSGLQTSLSTLRNGRYRTPRKTWYAGRARLCRGLHFRRLNSMSFQGTTLHRSGRADFRIRLLCKLLYTSGL